MTLKGRKALGKELEDLKAFTQRLYTELQIYKNDMEFLLTKNPISSIWKLFKLRFGYRRILKQQNKKKPRE